MSLKAMGEMAHFQEFNRSARNSQTKCPTDRVRGCGTPPGPLDVMDNLSDTTCGSADALPTGTI